MFDSNFSNLVSFLLFPVKFIYERETYRTRSNVNKNLSREKKNISMHVKSIESHFNYYTFNYIHVFSCKWNETVPHR